MFLTFPALTGLIAWQFLPTYSPTYAVLTTVWCTVFLEYWKIQQIDLSIRWDVKGVGTVKVNRPQFRWERVTVDRTGRKTHYVSRRKQVLRQLLQIPVMAAATLVLSMIILGVFALETLVSEGYNGPYKNVIVSAFRDTIPSVSQYQQHTRNMFPQYCSALLCRRSTAT